MLGFIIIFNTNFFNVIIADTGDKTRKSITYTLIIFKIKWSNIIIKFGTQYFSVGLKPSTSCMSSEEQGWERLWKWPGFSFGTHTACWRFQTDWNFFSCIFLAAWHHIAAYFPISLFTALRNYHLIFASLKSLPYFRITVNQDQTVSW